MSSLVDAVNTPPPFLDVTRLRIYLDGKRIGLLQNIAITGGIDTGGDMFLTVDGKMLVAEKEENKEAPELPPTTRIKTETLENGDVVPVTTTLAKEAVRAGGSRVIVKSIVNEDDAVRLNLMTLTDQ